MPYSEQINMLSDSKNATEATNICGLNEIKVRGFIPVSFDQNEDTYKALDDLGIQYDAGFRAGTLFAPGHERDIWPYKIENHGFFAVPVSTYDISGKRVLLYDRDAKENGLDASQWYDMLVGKYNEVRGKDEPMVIMISLSTSGTGEYNEAFKKFLDFAASNNASFVSTSELVEMARTGIHKPAQTKQSTGCKTCGQAQDSLKTSITIQTNDSAYNTTYELPGLTTDTASEPDTSSDKTSGCATCDAKARARQDAKA